MISAINIFVELLRNVFDLASALIGKGPATVLIIVLFIGSLFPAWKYYKKRKTVKSEPDNPPADEQAKPKETLPFYLPHSRNLLLQHKEKWIEDIRAVLNEGGKGAVSQGAVSQGAVSQVAVVGLGGFGKTAMAVEYAYKYRSDYPGGVYWLEVGQEVEVPILKVLRRMGVIWQNNDNLLSLLVDKLNGIEALKLVVLDNVEDVEVPDRFDLVNAHMLVTTVNNQLTIPKITMKSPDNEEGMEIFLSYAEIDSTSLNAKTSKRVRNICEEVGNLPLALEILGCMARSLGLEHVGNNIKELICRKANIKTKEGGKTSIGDILNLTGKKYNHPQAMEALMHAAYLPSDSIEPRIVAKSMGVDEKSALEMLGALADFSVIRLNGKNYSCHRIVQETAKLKDTDMVVKGLVNAALKPQSIEIEDRATYQKIG